MKHVFDEPGYLFVLMINSERLESLAEKRFGQAPKGEPYLDKFIDLRLGLPNSDEIRRSAVAKLVEDLPQFTPYNDHEAFSRAEAAKLAGELGVTSGLSMRKIKRTLLSVAVGIRMYPNKPIDCSLLLLFAFEISKDSQFMIKNNLEVPKISKTLEVLPRARFGPAVLKTFLESEHSDARNYRDRARKFYGTFGMLIGGNKSSQNLRNVAESYIPEHHRILSAALEVQAD